jgi:hypothetical protein
VTGFHVVAFGDLETGTWGVSWLSGGDAQARLAVRRGAAVGLVEGALERTSAEQPWRWEGEGASLVFTPTGRVLASQDADGRLERQDELCATSGRVRIEDGDTEVQCQGWRSSACAQAPEELGSLRFLAAWLDAGTGFSLLALRPRKARGHEEDIVASALLDDPAPPVVAEPRLSTTYSGEGLPARAGLELWLEEENASEDEDSPQHHYPRRAAGEAIGDGLNWNQGDLELQASLMRWHSHGHEGPGVYLLGQPR